MKILKTAVIPLAGKGTRLKLCSPYGFLLPKPLHPLVDKPILSYIMANLKKLSIERIIAIVSDINDDVAIFLKKLYSSEFNIDFVVQREPNGLGNALLLTKELLDEDFLVILGDDLTFSDDIVNIYSFLEIQDVMAIQASVWDENEGSIQRSCEITSDEKGAITEIKEKPLRPSSHIRGIGVYAFKKNIFSFIESARQHNEEDKEFGITEVISLLSKGRNAYTYRIQGVNINLNTVEDLNEARKYVLSKHLY